MVCVSLRAESELSKEASVAVVEEDGRCRSIQRIMPKIVVEFNFILFFYMTSTAIYRDVYSFTCILASAVARHEDGYVISLLGETGAISNTGKS